MKTHIEKCLSGEHLTIGEASSVMDTIMTGQATDSQIAGLMVALRAKGETIDELVGFARTMREHAVKMTIHDPDAIDMCGTGGDGLGTFNISTVASFVAAGAGVTVAKHGNRSVSSLSGSADVLTALGVNVQCTAETVQACIDRIGIGFLFAPLYHPAMKYAAKPRAELGVRSIFNMVGPLTNPAGVKRQLVGVYHSGVAHLFSGALQKLDVEKACIVYSDDGMDEVTLSGGTVVHEVNKNSPLREYHVRPEDFGFSTISLESLHGGDKNANAGIALNILKGESSPARNVVIANAALGIYVAGKAKTILEGTQKAVESIDSGKALEKLQKLIQYTDLP
ncbi:MAG: anthranilate phosphoribosyltransferase [Ignavibacteriae bacterium]|nr:MAG: anthranilate phosphoribosyltransferase [Ignavibacteriota bacterium]